MRIACGQRRYPIVAVTVLLTALLSVLGDAVRAADIVCSGVPTVANHPGNGAGGLWVQLPGTPMMRLCSFTTTQGSVSPEDCKHIASLVASANAAGRPISVFLTGAPADCSSIVPWAIVNTVFVRMGPG